MQGLGVLRPWPRIAERYGPTASHLAQPSSPFALKLLLKIQRARQHWVWGGRVVGGGQWLAPSFYSRLIAGPGNAAWGFRARLQHTASSLAIGMARATTCHQRTLLVLRVL